MANCIGGRTTKQYLCVEKHCLCVDDAIARKRKELAERLRKGQEVMVEGNTGEMKSPNEAEKDDGPKLKMDKAKLGNWYRTDKRLYKEECEAMKKNFPNFKLEKLDDSRLCWIGDLNPNGASGRVWTIMAVYANNHPHNNCYGGSVTVYSLEPELEELVNLFGPLPHTLKDTSNGRLSICTARPNDVLAGDGVYTSAATHIAHAVKWIKLVEDWMEGIVDDNLFAENVY